MAAPTAVEVWNLALSYLGATERVTSTTAQENVSARRLHDIWPTARREVMAAGKWDFATVTSNPLVLRAGDPVDDAFLYWYDVPSAVLRFLMVFNPEVPKDRDGAPHEIEKVGVDRVLMTDILNPKIKYIEDVEEVYLWSPQCVISVAYKLAERVAFSLMKDTATENRMRQLYTLSLIDGQSQIHTQAPEPPLPRSLGARFW